MLTLYQKDLRRVATMLGALISVLALSLENPILKGLVLLSSN